MESPTSLFSSPFTFLLITLVIIGILKVFTMLYQYYFYWKKKGILYINLFFGMGWKILLRRISIFQHSQYIYNYYPDAKYVGIIDIASPLLLVRDPELIKDIMIKDFEHFPDHRSFVDENVDSLFSKTVFFLRGAHWKEMRNTLSPSFTASKMRFMFDLISKCSRDFVDYLADHPELCSAIEAKEAFRRYTNDVIATAAFGITVNSMKERDNEFYTRGVETTKFSDFATMLKFIMLRASPRFSKLIGLSFFSPATLLFFKRIVQETIKVREKQGIIRPDIIHILMQARDKEKNTGAHEVMTLDDIVAQALLFFFAGFDTSATLMCFTAHELAVNSDIQNRLRQEVGQHLADGNGEVSYDSLSKMVYLDMVISETLRKYPPMTSIDRLCAKNYELPPTQPGCKSVIINPGNIIWFPVYALHHDPKYFPNPCKFDPERFSEENKDQIIPYTYLPFGHGPRKCLGNRFALMETKLLIVHLLLKFNFKTTEKTVDPMEFDKKEFVLQPKGGFWIRLEKRET